MGVLSLRRLAIAVAAAGLALAPACGGSDGSSKSSDESTKSAAGSKPTPGAASLAKEITPNGTTMRLGKPAVIRYVANPKRRSLLRITVTSVRRGRISDLKPFQLDRRSMLSNIYYATVRVRNIGNGNLRGQMLPLYAMVSETQVVPPVSFGSTFPPCNQRPLHKPFRKNARATVCLAFLAPRHGRVTQIDWRTPKSDQAISWTRH
jgi:hypothetical protein